MTALWLKQTLALRTNLELSAPYPKSGKKTMGFAVFTLVGRTGRVSIFPGLASSSSLSPKFYSLYPVACWASLGDPWVLQDHHAPTWPPALSWTPAPLLVFPISVMTISPFQLPRPGTHEPPRSAYVFCKKPNGKYLRLGQTYGLCRN